MLEDLYNLLLTIAYYAVKVPLVILTFIIELTKEILTNETFYILLFPILSTCYILMYFYMYKEGL